MLGESSFENEYEFVYGFSILFIRTLRGTSDLDKNILEKIWVESENKKINLPDLPAYMDGYWLNAQMINHMTTTYCI
jgi:hypothetical protein